MTFSELDEFIQESNRIAGIVDVLQFDEVAAYKSLLAYPLLTVKNVVDFCARIEPRGRIRRTLGMNVRENAYVPPEGGPLIVEALEAILDRANHADMQGNHPFMVHQAFDSLMPFMQGNGRVGRAVWAWMMQKIGCDTYWAKKGFLETWYRQSLSLMHPARPPHAYEPESV